MNPNPRPTEAPTPTPTLYGFPCPMWVLPHRAMTPLIRDVYTDALAVLTEPDGPTAAQWRAELNEDGYRALTQNLSLPQVLSLVCELPPSCIVRLTGRTPDDDARQEVVRALYAPAEL